MKVLIVSSYFPPHVGGVEVVAEQQARSLAEAGHTVVVATSRTEPATTAEVAGAGYDVVRLPVNNLLERRLGVPYPLIGAAFCRAVSRLVRWSDVVHLHDTLYQPVQLAALLARRAGKPIYVTQHIGRVHHPNRAIRAAARLTAAVAGRYIWRRARRIVAHNPLVVDYLRAQGLTPGSVVQAPTGIDTTVFAPGPAAGGRRLRERLGLPRDRPLVLFVGRLIQQKGYEHLVRAADPAYHIVLAGSGRPAAPLPTGVSWVGPVPRAELIELYRLAAVFVLPSAGEMFPLVVQEAMACGLPIVATDDDRYDAYDIDRHRLRLIQPAPDVLRRAITTIVSDHELARSMGEHSRDLACRHFDWRHNRRALARLYDEDTRNGRIHEGTPCTSASSS